MDPLSAKLDCNLMEVIDISKEIMCQIEGQLANFGSIHSKSHRDKHEQLPLDTFQRI